MSDIMADSKDIIAGHRHFLSANFNQNEKHRTKVIVKCTNLF